MGYKIINGITDLQGLKIKPKWTHCRVELWHSVRETPYWLAMDLHFTNPEDPGVNVRYALGYGEHGDHKKIFAFLSENGFQQVSRQVIQEWEYYQFSRQT